MFLLSTQNALLHPLPQFSFKYTYIGFESFCETRWPVWPPPAESRNGFVLSKLNSRLHCGLWNGKALRCKYSWEITADFLLLFLLSLLSNLALPSYSHICFLKSQVKSRWITIDCPFTCSYLHLCTDPSLENWFQLILGMSQSRNGKPDSFPI